MASRRQSVAQEVVGLPADDALRLASHDEGFFAHDVVDAESDYTDDDENLATLLEQPEGSDDDENLDATGTGPVDPAPSEAAAVAGKRKKAPRVPRTIQQVTERIQAGCKCQKKYCHASLQPTTFLELRNIARNSTNPPWKCFSQASWVSYNPAAAAALEAQSWT